MKKYLKNAIALTVILVILVLPVLSMGSDILTKIEVNFAPIKRILINNERKDAPSDMQPFMYNGRVYVSLRYVGEALGKDVKWDGASGTVTINEFEQPIGYEILETMAEGTMLKVKSNPQKGFNYTYYLFIPKVPQQTDSKLVVEGNNTGVLPEKATDMMTEERIFNSDGYRIAKDLNMPFLMPSFPRPMGGAYDGIYTHDLGRTTLLIPATADLGRIDLQMVQMINDAKEILKSAYSISVAEKVLMYGYSASSHFADRFSAIHPDIVQAVAAGGINSLPILPVSSYAGSNLRYPIGVDDFKTITGTEFNLEKYKQIPRFYFMGELDKNDTAPASDCFEPTDTELIYKILGKSMVPDRLNKTNEILKSVEAQIQYVSYKGIGHQGIWGYVEDDVVAFFKANWKGTKMNEITIHEYPDQKYQQ